MAQINLVARFMIELIVEIKFGSSIFKCTRSLLFLKKTNLSCQSDDRNSTIAEICCE